MIRDKFICFTFHSDLPLPHGYLASLIIFLLVSDIEILCLTFMSKTSPCPIFYFILFFFPAFENNLELYTYVITNVCVTCNSVNYMEEDCTRRRTVSLTILIVSTLKLTEWVLNKYCRNTNLSVNQKRFCMTLEYELIQRSTSFRHPTTTP